MAPLRIGRLAVGLCFVLAGLAADDSQPARELVRRLGDPAFAERDRASEAILRLGRSAVPALEEGLKDPDAEVRRRAADLLPLVRRSDLEIKLDAFVSGSTSAPPFPGWLVFRQLAGDDPTTRSLFVSIGRAEPDLLTTLEKDRSRVGAQLAERSRKLMGRAGGVRVLGSAIVNDDEIASLLLVAACSSDKNNTAANQFFNSLYSPRVRSYCRDHVAVRTLLSRFLARQLEEPWRLHQTVWLARSLGLTDLIENTLKPEARKQAVAAADKPEESGTLYQAAAVASMLGIYDTIEGVLKPAARRVAEKTAERPEDPMKVYQTLNLLQTLNMQDVIDTTLRPAAVMTVASVASRPYDQYRFQMALNLARTLQLQPAIEQVLKPAAMKALISLSQQIPKDPSQMYAALSLVQNFDLKEASDDWLKPAAHRLARAAVRSGEPEKLGQAAHLLTSLGVKDESAASLRAAVEKLAAAPTDNINRISELLTVAQSLGMTETVENALRAQARRALLAANDRPLTQNVHQALQLARTLQIKEAVPLALRTANEKKFNSWSRADAILFVADVGGKEHIPQLEGLFGDTASLGSTGINSTATPTELRDVALAASVHLNGESLVDYGYWYVKQFGTGKTTLSSMSAQCYGFADAKAREAAIKKWQDRPVATK